jgi:hypothetical protein
MYHYKILNRIKLYCFLKFVVHELNSKMVNGMVLTEKEMTDVVVVWKL